VIDKKTEQMKELMAEEVIEPITDPYFSDEVIK